MTMSEKIYGLIGRSLKHSYSVQIHKELGNGAYRLIELEPEELAKFLHGPEIGGLNVTIPYKREAMSLCDVLSPEAEAIGCVNTVVRRADGKLAGYNTDAYGLLSMARRAGIGFQGEKTVIFGSGGASRTVQAVAREMGAKQVVVISRSGADNYGNLIRHCDAELLINATPVGMYPDNGGYVADPADFPCCEGVLDLIYNPRRTALIMRAESLGIPYSDGLPMLVAQAKAAEEHFMRKPIPDTENERILRAVRKETDNIVLIGMPGCGKSTVGRALSRMTGRCLIDIDEQIERRAGKSIEEIFKEDGEAEFRRLEREEIVKAGAYSGSVIAVGGGAVKDGRNYPALHQNSWICHIERDIALLPRKGRPLSQKADLYAMYSARLPMYERFRDAAIEGNGTAEDAAQKIWRDFCEAAGD